MSKERLVAFSDGVFAVIITIMVLELKVPHGAQLADLAPVVPVFFVYLLSFIYVGIYWNNHHHLLYLAKRIDGRVMWTNLFLLFWLSLLPFTTAWMGENHYAAAPTAVYGVVLLLAGVAYVILQSALVAVNGADSSLAHAIGSDWKGKASVTLYLLAIGLAFWNQWVSDAIYVAVAGIWFVPDRRIERTVKS